MIILYFFVARAYLARLNAMSAVTTYQLAVTSWDGLVASGQPVGIVAGSASQAWLDASTVPSIRAVLPQLQYYDSLSAGADAVRDGAILALITESSTANYVFLSPPCDPARRLLPVYDTRFNFGIGSVAFGYFSNYSASAAAAAAAEAFGPAASQQLAPSLPAAALSAINAALTGAVEQSRVQAIADSYVNTAGNCGQASAVSASPITPDQLRGPFFIWGVAVALIIVAVTVERWGGCAHCVRTRLLGGKQQAEAAARGAPGS